jgi:predicted DsbA family dithiol-disulfide isomerase
MIRKLRMLVSFALVFFSIPAGFSQDKVVAIVNGEPVKQQELDAAIRNQMDAINNQILSLKQTGLSRLIDNLLIHQAARAEGISVEQYLATHVERITVSSDEVDDAYERSKNQLPPTLVPEAKYRIRRSLEDNRRGEAMQLLLQKLRRQAQVENLLLEQMFSNLNLAETEGPSLGNPDAPVTIVVFNDLECPFCRSAAPLLRRALDKYPEKVRLVSKHFPLESHANAFTMARGAVCAQAENRFWEFHDRIFEKGVGLNEDGIVALAASLGLDRARFSQCLGDAKVVQTIQKDIDLGRAAGVTGTPSLFVNKRRLNNVTELDAAIQEALSKLAAGTR